MTIQEIVDKILEFPERTKLQILSPVVRGQKGTHKKLIDSIAKKMDFVRIRVDGENHEVTDEIELNKNQKHNIEVVVDRIVVKDGIEARLADSIETAVKLSDGLSNCSNNRWRRNFILYKICLSRTWNRYRRAISKNVFI